MLGESRQKVPDHLSHIGSCPHGGDHRDAIGACSDGPADRVESQAADGEDREVGSGAGLPQPLETHDRLVIRLRAGVEDRSESKIVGSSPGGLFNLIERMGRDPDNFPHAHHGAGIAEREIPLAQVHAIGFHGQGKIAPIINHQDRTGIRGSPAKPDRVMIRLPHGPCLIPILK